MKSKSSQSQQVYLQLRDRIANGHLRPGDVVSESSLAKEFGVSRTPIGEALRQLANEGVVNQVPRFGTIVRDVPIEELAELYEIREALEGMAAYKAAQTIGAATLGELRGLCGAIDEELSRHREGKAHSLDAEGLRRFLAADMAFHMLVIASAGNKRLNGMIEQTRTVSLMFAARRGEHAMSRVEQANKAHIGIVDALEAKDGDLARQRVVEHIRSSREQSLNELSKVVVPASLGSLPLPDFIRRDLAST